MLVSIAANYNESLEAAHAHVYDDRYDRADDVPNWTSQISSDGVP